MTICITQTCDRCGTERDLTSDVLGGTVQGVKQGADLGGWRELTPNKHVCPTCIATMITPVEPTPEEPEPTL